MGGTPKPPAAGLTDRHRGLTGRPCGRVAAMDWQSESPELWAFLESLRQGQIMSGTVSAIERFGVFVALDNSPGHPIFPGVGFIKVPELSWRHIDAPNDVVDVGRRSAMPERVAHRSEAASVIGRQMWRSARDFRLRLSAAMRRDICAAGDRVWRAARPGCP